LVTDAGVTIIGGENIKNAKINAAGVRVKSKLVCKFPRLSSRYDKGH